MSFQDDVKVMGLDESLIKHNLSLKDAFESCLKSNWKKKKSSTTCPRYIQYKGNYYTVRKYKNRKLVYFGKYKTEKDAIKVRDYFMEHGWDKTQLTRVCRLLNVVNLDKKKKKKEVKNIL